MASATDGIRLLSAKPTLVTSGMASPQVQDDRPSVPQPRSTGLLESATGSDWSMNISPREWHAWENDPERGYGGEEHNRYVANFHTLLDEPVIPKAYVSRVVGGDELAGRLFPNVGDRDLTMREYLGVMPLIRDMNATLEASGDPERFAAARERLEQTKALYKSAPDGVAFGEFVHPDSQAAVQFLTGQRGGRESQAGADLAHGMMAGLALGTKGGPYESDPSMSQQSFDNLKEQKGEAAYRHLTQGAQQNTRREQVLDFVSALSDDERFQPQNMDAMTMGMLAVQAGEDPDPQTGKYDPNTTRWEQLTDRSAPRGRMAVASDRLEGIPTNRREFRAVDQVRTEPTSFSGLNTLTGHPGWSWGRTQLSYQPLIGDMGSRASLATEYNNRDGQKTPYQFFADARTRTRMESPVAPGNMTKEEFNSLRKFVPQHDAAMRGYNSAWYGPPMSRAMGMPGAYFSPAMDVAANLPQEAFKGMLGTSMMLAPVVSGAGKAVMAGSARPFTASLAALPASVAGEAVEESWQTPITDGISLGDYTKAANTNAYLLPQDRGISPADKQNHDDALYRARDERKNQLVNQFRLFNNNRNYIPGTVPPGVK